jgi:hypothetical protein
MARATEMLKIILGGVGGSSPPAKLMNEPG